MEVVQFRGGFATNSSSSHSIIYYPGGASDNDTPSCQEYGWQWFTLGSREEKAEYAAQAFKHLPSEWLQKYLGVDADPNGYIDHESVGMLGWVQTEKDLEMFVRLYIDNENVVILGGNDNDDCGHPLSGPEIPGFSPTTQWRDGDNFLVIFDTRNGDKTHLAKHPGVSIGKVPADFPELVDLKISDYCTLGCSFCYQNSTRRGKHGDIGVIKSIIHELGLLGTLEIAIGGGEPLQYPHLREVLEFARENGITPNFTTKDYSRLAEHSDLLDLVGGVAISVASIADVHEAVFALAEPSLGTKMNKLSFQIPVGAQSHEEFKDMLSLIHSTSIQRVTLLGYKMVGRGTSSKYQSFEHLLRDTFVQDLPSPYNPSRINKVAVYPRLNIGIDTQLANLKGNILDIVPYSARSKVVMQSEGLHSCYIDAVTGRIAPSSYCDESLYQPLTLSTIGEKFNEFSSEACEALMANASANGSSDSIDVQVAV